MFAASTSTNDTFRQHIEVLVYVVLLLAAWGEPLYAQEAYQSPRRFWQWAVDDVKALPHQFTPRMGLVVAGSGVALFGLGQFDARLATRATTLDYDFKFRVIEEFGNVKAIRPVAFLLFSGSLMTRNYRFQDAAFTSMQAVYISNVFTNALKALFGRARPFQNQGHTSFEPFSGNSSFPSGHATTAFAFLTPWLLYYPRVVGPTFGFLAVSTAFSRLVNDFHWLTDVTAGSAIGFATAYWLTHRHQGPARRFRIVPSYGLNRLGFVVQF